MGKYIISLFIIFSFLNGKAQECSCGTNFSFMVKKIKQNYVGYNDKITVSNKRKFDLFTDSLFFVAQKSDKYECSSVMREWLSFFKDKHMIAGIDATGFSADSIRKFYMNDKKKSWTEMDIKAYLTSNKNELDDIEGVWFSENGSYKIGIVRNDDKKKNSFVGFIIKGDSIYWMPKQIKFEITKVGTAYKTKYFRLKDHSYSYPNLLKDADTLSFGIYGKWYKTTNYITKKVISQPTDLSPKFRVLDNETSIFFLPSFGSLGYIKTMDTLVENNRTVLKNTKHLIIDLRNNSGGSVLVYQKLMAYIYTNPILTEGGMVLATDDNIKAGYSNIHPELSDSLQRYFKQRLEKLTSHKGQLYELYPIDTIRYSTVLESPKRISFMINRNTGSAAELFLLEAKQSTKVKLYGENTAGAVDYTESIKTKMPCDFFVLYYPACKSLRLPDYPIDNIGITPDVKIPVEITDWIEYVRKNY